MQPPQCVAESGPAALRYPAGILPFWRIWHLIDAVADALAEHLAGQPGSQCINRLKQRQISAVLRRHDVVGVRHLQRVVVALDTARHETDFALGQLPLHERMIGVEEYEVEAAGIVLRRDLVGSFRIAARRRLVLQHPDGECRNGARHGRRDGRLRPAIDDSGRQMPDEIENPRMRDARRQSQRLLQQQRQPRADAG